MKYCKTCLKNKELSEYHKDKNQNDGFRYTCKQCIREYQLKWRESKRKELLEKSQVYYVENKDKKRIYDMEYRLKNFNKIKDRLKNNKDKINKRTAEYAKSRRAKDISYKLRQSIRNRLNQCIKKKKPSSSITELGCSLNELKIYLECRFTEGMSWNNYGKWHLDHIKPLSKFNLSDLEEFKQACHYTNLQPLWALDNIKKSNKY